MTITPSAVFGLYFAIGALVIWFPIVRPLYMAFFGGDNVTEQVKKWREYFESKMDAQTMAATEANPLFVFTCILAFAWLFWFPIVARKCFRVIKEKLGGQK